MLGFADLSDALDAEYEVQREPEHPRGATSPLHLVLGVADAPPEATRIMELVHTAGIDWACDALGEAAPEVGAIVFGHAAATMAERALRQRADDLAAFADTAVGLLGQDAVAQLDRDRVQGVLDTVRVRLPSTVIGAGSVYEEHESDDLVAVATIDLLLHGRYWTDVRRSRGRAVANLTECQHCGHLFVPTERVDEIYCRRAAPGEPPGGRKCEDVGPQRRYHDDLDELTRTYRREYKRLDNHVRRDRLTRDQLDEWRTLARALLEQAQSDGWDVDHYRSALVTIEPGGDG